MDATLGDLTVDTVRLEPGPAETTSTSTTDVRPRNRRRRWIVIAGQILLPVVFLTIWQVAANRGSVNQLFFSKPTEIFDYLKGALTKASTWDNLWVTLKETFAGFAIATVMGIATGLLFTRVPILHDITRPYLTALNSLPRVALAPLFTLWFGLGMASKVALVISLCFFIVLSATMGAIGNVDPDLVRLARVLGFSPSRVFMKVMLRWAVPGIFAGLELALVYAFVGAVAAEMISSQKGVGQQIQFFSGTLNTPAVLGTLILLAVVTTVFSLLMDAVRRHLTRYQQ
jgi:NitT/TauT family transport system permease protein